MKKIIGFSIIASSLAFNASADLVVTYKGNVKTSEAGNNLVRIQCFNASKICCIVNYTTRKIEIFDKEVPVKGTITGALPVEGEPIDVEVKLDDQE